MRNKFVSVMVEGKLCNWTGKNPDKFPETIDHAWEYAKAFQKKGKRGVYPVVVVEILPEDGKKEEPDGAV